MAFNKNQKSDPTTEVYQNILSNLKVGTVLRVNPSDPDINIGELRVEYVETDQLSISLINNEEKYWKIELKENNLIIREASDMDIVNSHPLKTFHIIGHDDSIRSL